MLFRNKRESKFFFMTNPFDLILERLDKLDNILSATNNVSTAPAIEIIDRIELRKRLAITEPTIIRWEKKGKIPAIRVGSSVRYNWPAVIESLESKNKRG